ncbi:CDP-alcohol phosphatidyltransferase family protein (plasmid) [Mesorhizobium sp. AR02]|uniref:CDP-alcohol phosphatidyltransferase family protein n=1 Tax=Mesorhizobium sp. AR02 TaxID=2865837 RepID=UPI00215EE022|nr:CDP-alcohol phosphatidyltransferase family protein [Mesorhizobium sp. AR02]UVK49647.1 CDP-alcohol phosphatidyltransferase family protein [Mesorhizobium sp. AR02]
MLKELKDPANLVTVAGLLISVLSINLAIEGRSELAVATALWALLADHLDGVVAKWTANRSDITKNVGKSLDSLADLVSAGIFPGILLTTLSGGATWAIAIAGVLGLASALRLSYFGSVGLQGGNFIGVPTTYVLPVVAAIFMLKPWFPGSLFVHALGISLLTVAIFHVSPLRVPPTRGAMYGVVTAYCVLSSALLAFR